MDMDLEEVCGRFGDPLQVLRSGSTPAKVWILEVS
jgi:hypothetical protein